MPLDILASAVCPRCGADLNLRIEQIRCLACGQRYPRLGRIPILFREPDTYLSICRRQLALLGRQTAAMKQALEEGLDAPDVLPLTVRRALGLVTAAEDQAADVRAILQPLLPDESVFDGRDVGDDLPSLLTNIHYAFRDWGSPREPDGENERSLALVQGVLSSDLLGRTLVVGAGACRLAYDLHRLSLGAETIVVDIDALLFAVAHEVIRGGTISIRETSGEINELDRSAKDWTLTASHGRLGDNRFHFVLANGLEPPFAHLAFDTVVTPWFLDAIPADMRRFISAVYRLLKPGGRWVNVGPLRYPAGLPVRRWYTRQEIFDLVQRAGFRIASWNTASLPYLVSTLTQRGKIEWVLAFEATKAGDPAAMEEVGMPNWLLFGHVPVPTFEGQSSVALEDPVANLIISAVDGHRTLDELVHFVARQLKPASANISQVGKAVRLCLLNAHPACRTDP